MLHPDPWNRPGIWVVEAESEVYYNNLNKRFKMMTTNSGFDLDTWMMEGASEEEADAYFETLKR